MNIAKKLKVLRTKSGLSQRSLAEKAGVSAAFVSKIESGEYSTLSIDTSHQLAKGLGMTFKDFLEAVGFLQDESTANTDLALSSALRSRNLSDEQVDRIVSFVEHEERRGSK